MPNGTMVQQKLLEGDSSLMLPMEYRNFSAPMDFSNIQPGGYRLSATLEYGEGLTKVKERPIIVSQKEQYKAVELASQAEYEKQAKIKW